MESNPDEIKENPREYIAILNNFIEDLRKLKRFDESITTINKLKAVEAKSETLQSRIFVNSFVQETLLYITSGEFEKGISLVKTGEKGLVQFERKINKTAVINIYYNISILYFGHGDYNKAKTWLNKILNDTDIDMAFDIHCFARMVNLVVHFELGERDLLEYLCKSTYLFFKKRKRFYKFETAVLQFIRTTLPKIISQADLIFALINLRKELLKISKNPFEQKALDFFDFISWLESKIEKRSFADIIREKGSKKVGK